MEALILDSARDLFAERGYRVSTRDIASLAGVPEPLLFRKHGSKPKLFEAAVTKALVSFYKAFDKKHLEESKSEAGLADRGYLFTNELYQLISDNRRLIFSYLSAREFESELADMPRSDGLKDYFARAERSLRRRYELLGLQPSLPPEMSGRLAFVTVVAAVLFKDWVFAEEDLSEEQFIDGLNRFVLRDFSPPTGEHMKKKEKSARPKVRAGGMRHKAKKPPTT